MQAYDFDKVVDRTNSNSQKWEKYAGRDILPMWVADSDFEVAPEIIEAMQKRVAHGVFGYAEQPAEEVKSSIRNHLELQYHWAIDEEWIVPLPSLVSGLALSCLMTDNEGDEVLTPAVIYPPFKYVISNTNRKCLQIPAILDTESSSERWILDFDALEKAITPKTKLLLFCNPQNPSGTVYTKDELEKLHHICKQHDLLICSDEVHCDLILDDKKHLPFATLNNDASERTITLMAASKTFNIAGLGFGFAIISSKDLREKFKVLVRTKMPDVNVLAQTATEAAFNHGENWRQQQINYLRLNRDYLMQEINSIKGLKMYPLEATFLAWIDVSGLKLEDPETFFENAGVGISAGKYFGDDNFIRLNFACRKSLLEEAVLRIKKAVNKKAG